jgi:hypothetical protein
LSEKALNTTVENIRKVSLVFFIVLGTLHIFSGLMASNNYMMPTSFIMNRVLDIPFAMSALLYGLSNIYASVHEHHQKIASYIISGIALLVFLVLIYINLLVPDKIVS